MEEEQKEYMFNDVKILIAHILNKIDSATPLKLQKSLYFLWSFYSATYGNINYEEDSEFNLSERYPKYLFPAEFEAWKYGPVMNNVYAMNKNNELNGLEDEFVPSKSIEKEVVNFIDDLLNQINDIDDFSLVARSHNDYAWKSAYKDGQEHCKMDNDTIKNNYIEYVDSQNEL